MSLMKKAVVLGNFVVFVDLTGLVDMSYMPLLSDVDVRSAVADGGGLRMHNPLFSRLRCPMKNPWLMEVPVNARALQRA